jgi:hypothetical protein
METALEHCSFRSHGLCFLGVFFFFFLHVSFPFGGYPIVFVLELRRFMDEELALHLPFFHLPLFICSEAYGWMDSLDEVSWPGWFGMERIGVDRDPISTYIEVADGEDEDELAESIIRRCTSLSALSGYIPFALLKH